MLCSVESGQNWTLFARMSADIDVKDMFVNKETLFTCDKKKKKNKNKNKKKYTPTDREQELGTIFGGEKPDVFSDL